MALMAAGGGPAGFSLALSQTMSLGKDLESSAARWANAISENIPAAVAANPRRPAKARRVSISPPVC